MRREEGACEACRRRSPAPSRVPRDGPGAPVGAPPTAALMGWQSFPPPSPLWTTSLPACCPLTTRPPVATDDCPSGPQRGGRVEEGRPPSARRRQGHRGLCIRVGARRGGRKPAAAHDSTCGAVAAGGGPGHRRVTGMGREKKERGKSKAECGEQTGLTLNPQTHAGDTSSSRSSYFPPADTASTSSSPIRLQPTSVLPADMMSPVRQPAFNTASTAASTASAASVSSRA